MGRKDKPYDWIIVDLLAPIILSNVEGSIVDIGIGASTYVLSKHARKFARGQYSCDISPRRCEWARTDLKWPKVFECRSSEFIKRFPDIPVAIVLIDGEHTVATVSMEVDFFLPKLSVGGVMFLHDTLPKDGYVSEVGKRCGDVYKVRQTLEKDHSLYTFTWPYTAYNYGLTMVMKKELNAPFHRR